jgi:hypothetical protein
VPEQMGRFIRTRRRDLPAIRSDLARGHDHGVFDPSMTAGLPGAAQRYLTHAIAPGARLCSQVKLTMRGRMRLKPGARWMPMRARQVLAPPRGFVWEARIGWSALFFSGFDLFYHGHGEVNWRLMGVIPLAQQGGQEIDWAAGARLAGEAVFVPPALLPQRGAVWTEGDDRSARVRLEVGGEHVEITIAVDDRGRLEHVSFPRWNKNGPGGKPGYLPFIVDEFGDEQSFGGITIPTRFCAGWRLADGTEFRFFEAQLESAAYC